MPGPTDPRHNEDQEYLNDLLSNLDDVKQSYIMSQTEANIRQNVSNIEVGYTRIRAYLLEKDIPPAPPGIPDISKPELLQYEQKRLKSISPDFYDHQGSVPPELQMLNLYDYMPFQPDPDELYRKACLLKEENRRKLLEQREKARQEKLEAKEASKADKLKRLEEKKAIREMSKESIAPNPAPPKKVEKNGSIVRYLIELSDFSDYLRYRISRQGGFYRFFHCASLIIILLLILLATSITAWYTIGCCQNSPSIIGAGSQLGIDPKFIKEINSKLDAIMNKVHSQAGAAMDDRSFKLFIKEINNEFSKTMGTHTEQMSNNIKKLITDIKYNMNSVQGKDNVDFSRSIRDIQQQLEKLIISINNMQHQPVIQQTAPKEHPFKDLLKSYNIINKNISGVSMIQGRAEAGNTQQKLEYIWSNRSNLVPKQCFRISQKYNYINITSKIFVPHYLIIGHPPEGDTIYGRQTAPEYVKVTVEQWIDKTTKKLVPESYTFHYDLNGDVFQKFDFSVTPFAGMKVESIQLEFSRGDKDPKICLYQVLVLGKYVE